MTAKSFALSNSRLKCCLKVLSIWAGKLCCLIPRKKLKLRWVNINLLKHATISLISFSCNLTLAEATGFLSQHFVRTKHFAGANNR